MFYWFTEPLDLRHSDRFHGIKVKVFNSRPVICETRDIADISCKSPITSNESREKVFGRAQTDGGEILGHSWHRHALSEHIPIDFQWFVGRDRHALHHRRQP